MPPTSIPGDLVALSGELGSGKTTFARALIRTLSRDAELEVPSPTYTLMQVYDGAGFPIVHADLFRINSPSELAELGWEESAEDAVVIVEWPEQAGDSLPSDRLEIRIELAPELSDTQRRVVLSGNGTFAARLGQSQSNSGLALPRRMERRYPQVHAGRCLDTQFRAASEAGRKHRHFVDLAGASRRAAGALREAV